MTDLTTQLLFELAQTASSHPESGAMDRLNDLVVKVNRAISLFDALDSGTVLEVKVSTAPPSTPAEGDRYLLVGAPTGDWSGKGMHFAIYLKGAWDFVPFKEGKILWDETVGAHGTFDGSSIYYLKGVAVANADTGTPTAAENAATINSLLTSLRNAKLIST